MFLQKYCCSKAYTICKGRQNAGTEPWKAFCFITLKGSFSVSEQRSFSKVGVCRCHSCSAKRPGPLVVYLSARCEMRLLVPITTFNWLFGRSIYKLTCYQWWYITYYYLNDVLFTTIANFAWVILDIVLMTSDILPNKVYKYLLTNEQQI